MTDVIGRGVIEVSADSSKFKAGIEDAKRTIKSLGGDISSSIGTATKSASASIDRYVKSLQTAAATQGRSTRETELYKLALRGASDAQLAAANSALRLAEGYQRGQVIGQQLRTGFIALAAAAAAAAVGVAAGTIALINQVGKFQDLGEKIGDTARNVSSLKEAGDVSGTSLDTIASASVRLTAALSKTDDESAAVGKAIKALGLDFEKFKALSPVEQLQSVAGAMEGFADGSEKTAVAVALFGKSGADLLSFLKEYGREGLNAAFVTDEQANAADNFSDAQARLKSELQQFLQVASVEAIPVMTQVQDLFRTIASDAEFSSTATALIRGAMKALVVVFQTIVVVGSDVAFVLRGVYTEITGIGAQIAALGRLDLKEFSAISDAMKRDAARARAELDRFQREVMAIGSPEASALRTNSRGVDRDTTPVAPARRPRLNTSGLADKPTRTARVNVDNTAASEAKARLAADLDEIRKSADALGNTIANSEKLTEARRAAALISEADYYAIKRDNIQRNNTVQEAAAQAEISRLQQEVLTGKEKIDNDRKIADAQAKLNKLRENGAANLQVLSVQEKAALDQIKRAFDDARSAAQSYLDATERARNADLEGMGAGAKARDRSAAIGQITQEFEQKRQDLQRDNRNGKFAGRSEDFDRELALLNEFQTKSIASYLAYYEKLGEKQRDFGAGAREALANYADEAGNSFKLAEDAVARAFGNMEDTIAEFVKTGKLDFNGFANSIIADLTRIAIKQAIIAPLAAALGGGGAGGGFLSSLFAAFGSGGGAAPRAIGGPVSAGNLYRINERGPGEVLNVAGRQYLMANQQGNVTPAATGNDRPISLSQTFVLDQPASLATQSQVAAKAGRGIQRALARGTA